MSPLSRYLRRAARAEDGNATIEFVLVFPLIMAIFLASFELGLLQLRHTMLERGLDVAVRTVRLSTNAVPDYAALRDDICEQAMLVADCANSLKLEMIRLDPWSRFADVEAADCINRPVDFTPARTWTEGAANDLILLRACVLFDPLFPTTGIGYQLASDFDNEGAYALTAKTVFVAEPE